MDERGRNLEHCPRCDRELPEEIDEHELAEGKVVYCNHCGFQVHLGRIGGVARYNWM